MGRLTSTTAVVTGAGSGIGRATAVRLAAEGARVACLDVDGDAAGRTAAEVDGVAHAVDVSRPEALSDVARELGPVDVVVAGAGVTSAGSVETCTEDEWARVLGVNLTGVWATIKAFVPALRARGGGSVIAVASVAALRGFPDSVAYAASKGGVVALVRQAAVDLANDGIRVNAVAPGSVRTPFVEETLRRRGSVAGTAGSLEETLAQVAALHPLGRMGEPEDVAALIAFLASDDASWITGSLYVVDGGMMAR